jgi:tetratricopeptide (TPR) repeat protein
LLTNSSEAFHYYIHGYDAAMELDLLGAEEWFSKAIGADSSFISAYVLLSIAYRGLGEGKLAKKWCNMAYEKRQSLPLLGKLMLDHLNAYYYDTYDEQIKYLKQILEIDESNTNYLYFLGSAHHGLRQYDDAITYFEKALDIHKKWGTPFRFPFLYYWLGDSFHQLNNHKREKEVYELGLMVSPENPIIIAYQAICELSQGNQGKADDLMAKYKSIRKNNSHWPESRILTGIGSIYEEAEWFNEAEVYYRQALRIDPVNPFRMNALAWLLINNDIDVNEGMDLIEKSLDLNPDNWSTLDTYGWGLYKQGKFEESLKVLKDAWDLRPAYMHQGYLHIQEVEQALARQNQ